MRLGIVVFLCFLVSDLLVAMQPQGEGGIDDYLASQQALSEEEETQLVVEMDNGLFRQYRTDSDNFNTLLYLAKVRQGTPYLWGGRNWRIGVDCSGFTMKIFQDIGAYYKKFQSTRWLSKAKKYNGYYRVAIEAAKAGDMLVYGSYKGGWNGHVVILIDRKFRHRDFRGLVVGSHGNEVGVRFISYKGFPHYYRYPEIKLRNVLRVEDFAEREAS